MTKELHWIWEPDDQIWSNDFTCGRKTVWGFFLVLFLPNWWRLQKIVYHSCSWASHFSIHSQSANIWQRNTLTQLKREDAMGLCMCVCVCVFMCVHSTNKSNHKAVKVVMRWNLGSGNHNRQRSDDVWHKTRMHTCAYTLTQTDTHTHTHTHKPVLIITVQWPPPLHRFSPPKWLFVFLFCSRSVCCCCVCHADSAARQN